MKLIIHDLTKEEFDSLGFDEKDTMVVSKNGPIKHCIGCFGCWVKTPGACIFRDKYGDMGKMVSKCDELLMISKCVYGGFSPFVKNIFDRSISYVHPYFVIRNHEMHHRSRYKNRPSLRVWFYGDTSLEEKQTAQKLIQANHINFNSIDCKVEFFIKASEMSKAGGGELL